MDPPTGSHARLPHVNIEGEEYFAKRDAELARAPAKVSTESA